MRSLGFIQLTDAVLSGNKLTLIIPFLNEGDEVGNTLDSIRATAGQKVDILLINDFSTDGVDYRSFARKYNAIYVKNSKRLGVAASRDKGVALIKTPYFLLLDAHMRFYQSDWVETIVEELERDDRRLLCCNTKILQRKEEKELHVSSDRVFGARINLSGNRETLDFRWNYAERDKEEAVEDIACVMGAAYAASRRYWHYLKGLEGLMYYGYDEVYISCKVWLEGGRCVLLKDVVVGHIYRCQAPYKVPLRSLFYNKLLIAELLLPLPLKARIYGVLDRQDSALLIQVRRELLGRRKMIGRLKNYYKTIFSRNFNLILELNRPTECRGDRAIMTQDMMERMFRRMLLNCNTLPGLGLFRGRMGCVLFLTRYAHRQKNIMHISLVGQLIADLCARIRHELGTDFAEGISGIAYGLVWLQGLGLVGADGLEVLKELDEHVMESDLLRTTNFSLGTGVAGILYYILFRLRFAARNQEKPPFDRKYLRQVYRVATLCLKEPERVASYEMAALFVAWWNEELDLRMLPDLKLVLGLADRKTVMPAEDDWSLVSGWAGMGIVNMA